MAGESVHMVVRKSATGQDVYATSPQAPGLLYGCPTLDELRSQYQDVLKFHLKEPGPFVIQEHRECHYGISGGELVIRMALDDHAPARRPTFDTLNQAAVTDQAQTQGLVSAAANAVGEVVYICGLLHDTLGWVLDQLPPRGDIANVAVPVAGLLLVTVPFAYDRTALEERSLTIGAHAYPLTTELSTVIHDLGAFAPSTTAIGAHLRARNLLTSLCGCAENIW